MKLNITKDEETET
ncbi:hypothetical protein VULLAG_LOCUS15678 [Vulpes lagopus]